MRRFDGIRLARGSRRGRPRLSERFRRARGWSHLAMPATVPRCACRQTNCSLPPTSSRSGSVPSRRRRMDAEFFRSTIISRASLASSASSSFPGHCGVNGKLAKTDLGSARRFVHREELESPTSLRPQLFLDSISPEPFCVAEANVRVHGDSRKDFHQLSHLGANVPHDAASSLATGTSWGRAPGLCPNCAREEPSVPNFSQRQTQRPERTIDTSD